MVGSPDGWEVDSGAQVAQFGGAWEATRGLGRCCSVVLVLWWFSRGLPHILRHSVLCLMTGKIVVVKQDDRVAALLNNHYNT